MHKITKGLKKKKKGKKSKHKEEDLFKPEELEAYRREHQQGEGSENPEKAPAENEEWKKFIALTSGVDDVLKKTQGDLDRIKSTSFFQRVIPSSELKRQEEEAEKAQKAAQAAQQEQAKAIAVTQAAIVEVSDSESESEDDDIFDTTYIDALAAAEVKLAYIPESPTEEPEDDPFDTSYAEKAILGPVQERKGKKLVPIGAAVEILTGRVQATTCSSIARPNRRQILKERDLLLGSFEESAGGVVKADSPEKVVTLLDEDPLDFDCPIDLTKNLVEDPVKQLLEEFDVVGKAKEDDEVDEFAELATLSLAKAPANRIEEIAFEEKKDEVEVWNAFDDNSEVFEAPEEVDPFDTAFAENILPGKAELKLIEKEILNSDEDFDFNPRAEETYAELIRNKVKIQLTNPNGQRESLSSLETVNDAELNLIKPSHRDLLGGSTTDLTNLGDQPLKPEESPEDETGSYKDPFDTSTVETSTLPGQTELKFLERELLGEIQNSEENRKTSFEVKENKKISFESFDDETVSFDSFDKENRKIFENPETSQNRKVSFDLPLAEKTDLLFISEEEGKTGKPLTPYYVRENSLPEFEPEVDPFDTSFVSAQPGKAELKLIEKELFKPEVVPIYDSNFDPRDEKQVKFAEVAQRIEANKFEAEKPTEQVDLLEVFGEISTKVLTPNKESEVEVLAYSDPFDTSIASNILPGKVELKLLESELIQENFEAKNFNILEHPNEDFANIRALSPEVESFEDFDPFDTSIANNIAPGNTELKLLESEFITN